MAIVKQQTITQAKALIADRLSQLPECLGVDLNDTELEKLVQEMLE
ncbi:hypothetical protein [Synechocystis salina]|uniref:Uncharacterized protein n=1 Tax=Synechocystis salina LEGE 00031 TaxID=1828736 RepID=A0ABR9VX50_9SYNC|nr:hypothetical protein [Synechocystis salina]MBE9242532.1 hypothetical protein [Synechocystis salina LEGE 00041]MBE9255596.1 hypothetical protein [Synechocystis salina LEGE 00031]